MKLFVRTNLENMFVYREYNRWNRKCQYLIRKYVRYFCVPDFNRKRLQNRAAADDKTAFTGAWGAAPTSIRNLRSRKWRNRRFCAFGYKDALLAARKKCLIVRGVHVQPKSRKQCLWRAICEKRSFPPRRICAFSACCGTAPSPGEQVLVLCNAALRAAAAQFVIAVGRSNGDLHPGDYLSIVLRWMI